MTKHTNAEQGHRAGPTALADAELDQVYGGAAAFPKGNGITTAYYHTPADENSNVDWISHPGVSNSIENSGLFTGNGNVTASEAQAKD